MMSSMWEVFVLVLSTWRKFTNFLILGVCISFKTELKQVKHFSSSSAANRDVIR